MMEYFLVGALILNIGYLLELTSPTMEAAMVAVKMQHLGTMTIPICYCYFIYIYCFEEAPLRECNDRQQRKPQNQPILPIHRVLALSGAGADQHAQGHGVGNEGGADGAGKFTISEALRQGRC